MVSHLTFSSSSLHLVVTRSHGFNCVPAKKDAPLAYPYLTVDNSPKSAFACVSLVKRKSGKVVREVIFVVARVFHGGKGEMSVSNLFVIPACPHPN